MSTRADFYVGSGLKAEWLGSICYDGYQWAEDKKCPLMVAKDEKGFRKAVAAILRKEGKKGYATYPKDGWPWHWDTSRHTDYTYYWDHKKLRTRYSYFSKLKWPDMSSMKNVTFGSRSGVLIISG